MKTKYYVVLSGRTLGVFSSWIETNKQVYGYRRAKYKGFQTKEEAQEAWKRKNLSYKKQDRMHPFTKQQFHVVFIGFESGIFDNKKEADALTRDYPDGYFCSFFSREAANIALEQFLGIGDSDLLNSNQ